eukprot:s440_g10.t1
MIERDASAVASFGAAVPLVVRASPRGGRGVFAGAAMAEGQEVEVCPVLALQRDHIAAECAAMRYFFGPESAPVPDSVAMKGWMIRSKIGNSYAKKDIEDWQPRLKAQLGDLKRAAANRQCFDCGACDVTWASPKLGTFLCVTCSDIHRAAGAHITCVKNFSTYLWSPDEVEMMRTVGNRRAKELYRRGASLSWQPQDSKERKVKLCTELYGSEAVQRAVQQNIAAATAGGSSGSASATAATGDAADAAPVEGPNWLDDWTVPTVPTVPTIPVGDLLDWPTPKPTSPVVQHGDRQPMVAPALSKPVDDLLDIFGAPSEPHPAPRPAPSCSMQAEREKDFWDSVNWDELLG